MTVALFLAAAVVMALALTALVWALRGKRIDDHPLCRTCGFDLTGKPDDSGQCSECGSDLSRARAVVVGHRKRSYPLMFGAGAIFIVIAALFVSWGLVPGQFLDLTPYKPISWLISDLADNTPRMRWAAIAELRNRTSASTPPKDDLLAAADRVLAWQANPAKTWQPEMGDFIELLQAKGVLDPVRFERYLKNAASFSVKLRPDLRRGDPLPIRISPVVRLGNSGRSAVRHAVKFRFVPPSGKSIEYELQRKTLLIALSNTSTDSTSFLAHVPTRLLDVPDGPLTVDVRLTTEFFEIPAGGISIREWDLPLTNTIQTTSHSLRLLPESADNIAASRGDELHASLLDAVSKPLLEREYVPGGIAVMCSITFTSVPTDLAYDCVLDHGGQKTVLGQFAVPKGESATLTVATSLPKGSDVPKTATLILRPNPQAARQSVDLNTYADLELRWDNLRIASASPPVLYVPITIITPPTTAATTQPVR